MNPLTLYLAKLIGSVMLVMAVYMAMRRERLLALVERIIGDPHGVFWIGVMRLVVGLSIVIGHDVWNGALAVIVSLFGWTVFASGVLTLFTPHEKLVAVARAMALEKHYSTYAIGVFLFGLLLLVGGYAS